MEVLINNAATNPYLEAIRWTLVRAAARSVNRVMRRWLGAQSAGAQQVAAACVDGGRGEREDGAAKAQLESLLFTPLGWSGPEGRERDRRR